jgi:ABC-type uncharacterized transport system permease subunit
MKRPKRKNDKNPLQIAWRSFHIEKIACTASLVKQSMAILIYACVKGNPYFGELAINQQVKKTSKTTISLKVNRVLDRYMGTADNYGSGIKWKTGKRTNPDLVKTTTRLTACSTCKWSRKRSSKESLHLRKQRIRYVWFSLAR